MMQHHESLSKTASVRAGEASAQQPQPDAEISHHEPLKLPLVDPKIVVVKSRRRLRLYAAGKLVRIYRVGLGFNPVDDKIKEGDGATPEGEFYIFTKNAKSAYYLSLGLSYPNAEAAERGLRDALISAGKGRSEIGHGAVSPLRIKTCESCSTPSPLGRLLSSSIDDQWHG